MANTKRRSWNARLTADTYATLTALAEHYSTLRAPTSLTSVVEQAVKALAAREGVKPLRRHYRSY